MPAELFVIFHGIGSPPHHVSAEEQLYWISESQFRHFVKAAKEAVSAARVQIVATFDDGNRSDVEIAAPMLAHYGVPGIFFPCSARIGLPGYLTEDDLRLLDARAFEVGSHGMDHVPWRGLRTDALAREIVQSKTMIERILGHDISAAAVPFGEYDAATLQALQKSGYRAVYSSDPGISPPGAWFRHRWCYRNDRQFDIKSIARRSRGLGFRLVSQGKRYIKSRR